MATPSTSNSSSSSSRFARAACVAAGLLMLAGMFASSPWHPRALFRAGEPGVAFDWTRASLLYQDSARTTLVNAAGQPIGSFTDISGNGKHATQATSTSRGAWNGSAAVTDGADDYWATPPIDFSGSDEMTVIVALRKMSDAAQAIVAAIGNGIPDGSFEMRGPRTAAANNFNNYCRGTLTDEEIATGYTAPVTSVITASMKISTDVNQLRVDGAPIAGFPGDLGAGNFGNHVLYIASRAGGTRFFTGWYYRMIVIGRLLTAPELAKAEPWAAKPTGLVLP